MQILIADDHQLVREGLKLLIGQFGGAPQFYEAQDYLGLCEQLRLHSSVDLAVVDLQMPGADHGMGLARVVSQYPRVPVVVVSAFSSPDIIRKALAWPSVYAFVPKNGSPECMRRAMLAALVHDKIGEVTEPDKGLGDGFANPSTALEVLAPRLEAVRTLLRQGKSNKVIALELGLSEGTVKNYMSEIFKSLKVRNRTQAARVDDQTPL